MAGLSLDVADVSLCFQGAEMPRFQPILQKRYAAFASKTRPSLTFRMETFKKYGRLPSEPSLRFESGLLKMERSDFSAAYDPASKTGRLRVAENPYSFDSFLRVFLSWQLPRLGGLLVHAASSVRWGEGFLFPAVSGGGKSTLTRQAGDARPCTDEISLVRRVGGAYVLYGSPFWGELACRGEGFRAPLRGLYFLKKGPEAAASPLPRKDAVRRLLGTVMSFDRSPEGTETVFGEIDRLAAALGAHEFSFAKGKPFWHALRTVGAEAAA